MKTCSFKEPNKGTEKNWWDEMTSGSWALRPELNSFEPQKIENLNNK